MQLIKEIIHLAADSKNSVSDILRKCLVLAYALDNEKLKDWVENELNGYKNEESLPDYRKIRVVAKGLFLGPNGAQLDNQPLPAAVLKEEHRHFAQTANLNQPIIVYDPSNGTNFGSKANPRIDWPADLTAHYQKKFFEGYALNRAWQELPLSGVLGLADTVRNRTLSFALEIQKQLGNAKNHVSKLPSEKVDQIMTNNIYGGNVVIAGHATDITQIGSIGIAKNDMDALVSALKTVGLDQTTVDELKDAIEGDKSETESVGGFGPRTREWLKNLGGKLVTGGAVASVEIGKAIVTSWLLQYFGWS
jgi:AbiTii